MRKIHLTLIQFYFDVQMILFDVQMILFQAAKAAACQGVGHLSSSSPVPCPELWAQLSPLKNMLFFHGIGEV